MSLLSIEPESRKITREWLKDNGWRPYDKLGRSWIIQMKTTNDVGSTPYVRFIYTIRDPHKRIHHHLLCQGTWFNPKKEYEQIKDQHDLLMCVESYRIETYKAWTNS